MEIRSRGVTAREVLHPSPDPNPGPDPNPDPTLIPPLTLKRTRFKAAEPSNPHPVGGRDPNPDPNPNPNPSPNPNPDPNPCLIMKGWEGWKYMMTASQITQYLSRIGFILQM